MILIGIFATNSFGGPEQTGSVTIDGSTGTLISNPIS